MALTLSSRCAECKHTYNWHLGKDPLECRVVPCSCLQFQEETPVTNSKEQFDEIRARHLRQVAEDGKANPNRVTVESREEIRNAMYGDGDDYNIPVRFETKDSGERAEFESGMVRDTDTGKARFELLLPLGVPYDAQFLVRVAELLGRGAEKYDNRNWEKAQGDEEMERFKSSAIRHLMQWAAGETDEDHAAAVVFNLLGYETTKWKRDHGLLRPED